MKKTLLQVTLGTLFLMLACAAPGRAQSPCDLSSLTVTLYSATITSGNGVFDYELDNPGGSCIWLPTTIDFTGMGGVTGASVTPGSALSSDGLSDIPGLTNSTAAVFEQPGEETLGSGESGMMVIDCSSCVEGSIAYSISGSDPPLMGPNLASVGTPEPGSIALLLSGLAGLALLAGFARRKRSWRHAAASPIY